MLARAFGEPSTRSEKADHRAVAAELYEVGATPVDVVARLAAWGATGWDRKPTPRALTRQWSNLEGGIPDDWESFPVEFVEGGYVVAGDLLDDRTGGGA